jgi:hypothetical protein
VTFRTEADAAQITWKLTTDSLPEDARLAGPYTMNGSARPLCFPQAYAHLNLVEPARDTALSRFKADAILWHQGLNGGPTTHLCSSQVQCVNALAPFVTDPDGLRNVLGGILPIDQMLPFDASGTFPDDLVVFEWIGLKDYLGEAAGGKRSRGAHVTSADAAVRYLNTSGEIEIALLEWKYVERYSCGPLTGGAASLEKRKKTYKRWWSDAGPLQPDVLTYDAIFTEPLYQLFRLQCLAIEMENHREQDAERVRLVVAAPRRNRGFWNAIPHAQRDDYTSLDVLWQDLQRQPDRFHILDTATLVGEHGSGVADFRNRYAHLSSAIDTDVDQSDGDLDPLEDFRAAATDARSVIGHVFGTESVLERLAERDLSHVDPAILRRMTERLADIGASVRELRFDDLERLEEDTASAAGAESRDNSQATPEPPTDMGRAKRRPLMPNGETSMSTAQLKRWAQDQGCDVKDHPDAARGLTSKLLRFHWNGGLAVGVGSDAPGGVRLNAVVDALAWHHSENPTIEAVHVILGLDHTRHGKPVPVEHLDALGTVAAQWQGDVPIRLWTLTGDGLPTELEITPTRFTSATPQKWAGYLEAVASKPVEGMAAELVDAARHPAFALYPKLTGAAPNVPWQMRLDGLDIGRTGAAITRLQFPLKPSSAHKEPYLTWKNVVGRPQRDFEPGQLAEAADLIVRLAAGWAGTTPGAVLEHGSAEHALEAHVLSNRLTLSSSSGHLHSAVPFRSGMLGAAQFPTLWGDVTSPARYLDALLADDHGRPWAVELKDQATGGGHGRYLRHGITQAVLYRHYIRAVTALDCWFAENGLDRLNCQAALAFPTAAANATSQIQRHRQLARGFDVEIIEFDRPGGSPRQL